MRTFVVNNQKGGSGKTTTAVNLSAALAEKGRKVLLVDLDPQKSASIWLGFHNVHSDKNLFELEGEEELIHELKKNTHIPNLDIIPYYSIENKNSAEMKQYKGKAFLLKNKFSNLDPKSYDYIFFDCSPGLNLQTLNALVAADELLIPVVASYIVLYGVVSLVQIMHSIQAKLNPQLHISGILPCRVDPNVQHSIEVMDVLKERFGILLYKNYIREDSKLAESPSYKQSIMQYAPDSIGAINYRELAKEIIEQER